MKHSCSPKIIWILLHYTTTHAHQTILRVALGEPPGVGRSCPLRAPGLESPAGPGTMAHSAPGPHGSGHYKRSSGKPRGV